MSIYLSCKLTIFSTSNQIIWSTIFFPTGKSENLTNIILRIVSLQSCYIPIDTSVSCVKMLSKHSIILVYVRPLIPPSCQPTRNTNSYIIYLKASVKTLYLCSTKYWCVRSTFLILDYIVKLKRFVWLKAVFGATIDSVCFLRFCT